MVCKPAGLLAQGDSTGDVSLVDLAKEYRKQNEDKPGAAYIGLVHRLDRPVSGIVILTRTSKAAARLSAQFRDRTVEKRYLAVVEQANNPIRMTVGSKGEWTDSLVKDKSSNRSRHVEESEGEASRSRPARTKWRVLKTSGRLALLELVLVTGRSHQLRAHCAAAGAPIVGDLKYGSTTPFDHCIALHAAFLAFHHPTKGNRIDIQCPPPPSWRKFSVV